MWAYTGNMKSGGPEYFNVGQVKWQVRGKREVIAVPFETALVLHMGAKSPTDESTLKSVTNFMADCDHELIRGVRDEIVKATLEENSVMYLPPGWIMYERSLNNEAVAGFRIMNLEKKVTRTFSALLEQVLPKDIAQTKTGSPAAFLVKLLKAMETIIDAETGAQDALKLLPPKIELSLKSELSKAAAASKGGASGSAGAKPALSAASTVKPTGPKRPLKLVKGEEASSPAKE